MCCGALLVFWHGITNMYLPQPPTLTNNYGQSLDIVSRTSEAVTHALTTDVSWIVSVLNNTNSLDPVPDWSGTMARAAKDDGQLPGIATPFIFGPLIDSPPAHPDTVLSTLSFIERFLDQHGMTYMHISADLQIYSIILHVKWSNPRHWENIVVMPGGMHTLMSFVGCIGTLMRKVLD